MVERHGDRRLLLEYNNMLRNSIPIVKQKYQASRCSCVLPSSYAKVHPFCHNLWSLGIGFGEFRCEVLYIMFLTRLPSNRCNQRARSTAAMWWR
jgi:hypothetical protein